MVFFERLILVLSSFVFRIVVFKLVLPKQLFFQTVGGQLFDVRTFVFRAFVFKRVFSNRSVFNYLFKLGFLNFRFQAFVFKLLFSNFCFPNLYSRKLFLQTLCFQWIFVHLARCSGSSFKLDQGAHLWLWQTVADDREQIYVHSLCQTVVADNWEQIHSHNLWQTVVVDDLQWIHVRSPWQTVANDRE